MIVRTPPPAPPLPSVPIERIELDMAHDESLSLVTRTFHPAEGMDLKACINAIVNPEHGVLDLFACSRDWPHRIGKRGALGAGVSWPGPPDAE